MGYGVLHIINESNSGILLSHNQTFHFLIVANIILTILPVLVAIFALMALANNKKLQCAF